MSREDRSPEDEALYRQARRRYALKRGLATHAFVFVVVNAGLIALNRQDFQVKRVLTAKPDPLLRNALGGGA